MDNLDKNNGQKQPEIQQKGNNYILMISSMIFMKMMNHKKWMVVVFLVMLVYSSIFYYFFVGPTSFRWRALYGDIHFPDGYNIHGVDISHYQGEIDWERLNGAIVNDSPLKFIILKSTEGSNRLDKNFYHNFKNAKRYGFIRGVYHYWSNKSSAREQAYYFLSKVNLMDGDLPPVLDIESIPKDKSIEDFQTEILAWLHIIEDHYHTKPIIYTYYKFKQLFLNKPVFDDYPFWIAHYYVKEIEYKGKWKFWQHTDAGKVDGINGDVDLNVYNGSYYDLLQLTIGFKDNYLEQ